MRLLHLTRGITFRLIAMGILFIVVGSVMRYQMAAKVLRDGTVDVVSGQQLSLASYVADDINGNIDVRRQLLLKLATDFPSALLQHPQQLEQWLAVRHDISPLFSLGLVILPLSGVGALSDYPQIRGRRELDFRQRDWFIAARAGSLFYIGKPAISRTVHRAVVNFSTPLRNRSGDIIAVLMGASEIDSPGFLDLIGKRGIGKTGSFLLISPRDQVFVTASDPALRLQPLPLHGRNLLHDKVMQGWRGAGVTINAYGVETLANVVSVPSAGWVVVAQMPSAEVLSASDRVWHVFARNSIVSAVFLIIALILVLGYSFAPLRAAARQMRAMADGSRALSSLPVRRHDEVGEMVTSFNLLAAKLLKTEEQMHYLAHHDSLTGLPNRRAFMHGLRQSIALALRQNRQLALLYVDLDGFKAVNDQYGHALGDNFLIQVAQRLKHLVREADQIGRIGGDEFVLLMSDCDERAKAVLIAEKLIAELSRPFVLDQVFVVVGASIGIAMFPEQANEIDALMMQADAAMYAAKRRGRNCYEFATGESTPAAS
ncbi:MULTISPECIES: sensor domain-containing diguanylate cyclase [unclassified Undibacterium]|uniref:sensor domain-containing diguanylate cyclase n=1 Tax=unclassified Undibacterium TaxID=2630295 RepID=UPI002AC8B46F|nr:MULTISPECIES: sensor domain-containing diguanylate cyclase [unclassified Undibacterium]MEB0139407.1 sensor domain-containing diguanylate cyclase [Undibacterium sp. CCC2.1]MEB0173798.1 sensor domain-containing diguanylate cyclase [Undibacterium sp. CCC1.1]MEB0177437.1 sensor domain-containing diguanylate cyclase [Undibacterium sp. CCC3.4]MEB0216608.1 sensor domain-containing diguanylate cyclase [Undibacterium sp. 5I2]WPX44022.1 sensor domain-containing diguanylate cyclase [Undibacterium sp. 